MMNAMVQSNVVKPGLKRAQVYYSVPFDTSHEQITTHFHPYHTCLTTKPCHSMFLHGILYVLHAGNELHDQSHGTPYQAAYGQP